MTLPKANSSETAEQEGISPVDEKSEVVKPEIKLLFFGTFFHDVTDQTVDLIQFKETTQVTEIRVIPLGATVDLSTGAFQLGATNPSEFDLEVYYNDLQVPTKSTFELLRNFKFNDKSRIQLVCDPDEQIITDGLLVRGYYSAVTLAVYGFTVDKVPIKEITPEKKKESSPPQSKLPAVLSPHTNENEGTRDIESPEKAVGVEADTVDEGVKGIEREAEVLVPLETQLQAPQAIPTITTRVNYDSVVLEDEYSEASVDPDVRGLDDGKRDKLESGMKSHQKDTDKIIVPIPPEVMDTEEISDGEVFPSDDEEMKADTDDSLEKSRPGSREGSLGGKEPNNIVVVETDNTSDTKALIPLIEEVEPISSPPQDQMSDVDDSLLDEFQGPGFEEIISDEEMPDFPEYDYGEWEENWAHKFTKTFNPFSDAFQVSRLQNLRLKPASFGICQKTPKESWEVLIKMSRKFSASHLISEEMQSWVEEMEGLIPVIGLAFGDTCERSDEEIQCVKRALLLWVDIGTNLKVAMEQPIMQYKTRHLKVGVKLTQCLASVDDNGLIASLLKMELPTDENNPSSGRSIQHRLLDFLKQPQPYPYVNNVFKLSVLRAIDSTISTKLGFESFIVCTNEVSSSYQQLIDCALNPGFSTRTSFSFRSLNKKVHLMQGLLELEGKVKTIARSSSESEEISAVELDLSECVNVLEDLKVSARYVEQYFSHPSRLLPTKTVVQLPPLNSTGHDSQVSFVRMLKECNFVQIAAVLVNSKEYSAHLVGIISEIIGLLLKWESGLIYLSNEEDATTLLLRSMLQFEDDVSGVASLACHCMEVLKCIDILSTQCHKIDVDEDRDEEIQSLQTVVSFLTTSVGREALTTTLSKGNLVLPLLKCLTPSSSCDPTIRFSKLSKLDKSARKGYAIEILEFLIRNCDAIDFLEKHGPVIHSIISTAAEHSEGCEKLVDVQSFLKPTLSRSVFTLEGIEVLCDIVKSKKDDLSSKSSENNWGLPGELITSLRILCALVTAPEDDDVCDNVNSATDERYIRQLKYDLALVRIRSVDLISTLLSLLQKIVDLFLQPTMHAHVFVSSRGDALLSLLLPLVKVLRKSICQVIQVRATEFRDVTPVPVLIKVFGLVECFPSNSLGFTKAQEAAQNIVATLLAYTVPAVKVGAETEEELNKSTWTAVVSEIIKFSLDEPANFQCGVSLLGDILPLPLPLASKCPLSVEVCSESVKLRRLWSAYIHGLSPQLQELIGILCGSTNARLLILMKRLCVQLADLSASTCMVVCRALLDAVLQSLEIDSEPSNSESQATNSQTSSVKTWVDMTKTPGEYQCSAHTMRLLGFLASLVNNFAPIKCGILHAIKGSSKIDEKYGDLLTCLCSIVLTKPGSTTPGSHVQGQDHVVTIFQSFCDVEINMLCPMFGQTEKTFDPEVVLANSLPQRDHMVSMCSTLLTYLSQCESKVSNNSQVIEGVLRTMEIITETDYGFFHLRSSLEKVSGSLSNVCKVLASSELENADTFETLLPCIISFLDLIKSLTSARPQQMGSFPPRCSVLKPVELRRYLEWESLVTKLDIKSSQINEENQDQTDRKPELNDSDDHGIAMDTDSKIKDMKKPEAQSNHPLVQIKNIFEKQLGLLRDHFISFNSIEPNDLESGIQIINNLIQFLTKDPSESGETKNVHSVEVVLQLSENLLELYSMRPIYVVIERTGNETLPIFWLTSIPPAFELDSENTESELVSCDLDELSRTYLSNFDVAKEIENLAKASDLRPSNGKEENKPGDPNYKPGDGSMRAPSTSMVHMTSRRPHYNSPMRGGSNRGGFGRGLLSGPGRMGAHMYDPFRSRPPNTSRPPSLHVDDFVALESSGQSGNVPLRAGGADSFSGRGRGGPRGGLLPRPFFHDRGRNRPVQNQGNYYQPPRHDSSPITKSRGLRGGRIFVTPTSDRWTADSRSGQQSYNDRNNRSGNYDDKYRSGSVGPIRTSGVSSPRTYTQPYPQRPGYRDSRPGGSSSTNNNSARWRDRQKPFSR